MADTPPPSATDFHFLLLRVMRLENRVKALEARKAPDEGSEPDEDGPNPPDETM